MRFGRESSARQFLKSHDDLPDAPEKPKPNPAPTAIPSGATTDNRPRKRDNSQVAANNHRARKRGLTATLTVAQWVSIKRAQHYRCAICKSRPLALTLNHILPLSRGGGAELSNVQALCHSCNSSKSALDATRDIHRLAWPDIFR